VLATSTGGVGQHVRSLAEQLVSGGWQVAVLGPAATEELFGFTAAGAAFAPVEIAGGLDPLADVAAARRLAGLVGGADVVHAHGLRAGLVGAAALGRLRGRTGRPPAYLVTWHNAVLGGGPRRRVYGWLERVVARSADVTLGASSDLVERVRALGGADVRLGPVSAPPLEPPSRARAEVRAELGAADRPLLLCVGRLHPQKGYPVLLDAARTWARRDPVPLVAVAGSGPSEGVLAARIAAEGLPVSLLGRRPDVPDLLAAADLVVLPSVWEARALVAQEALRSGVPLVATRVGGIPELVGDAALLVPSGDAAALAAAVERVLDDPAVGDLLAARGRRQAQTWPDDAGTAAHVAAAYADARAGLR
jgi:glycosyltransferase involved in cell wall biosynthesis